MKSKHFASICTGTSNAFRRRAGTRSVGMPHGGAFANPFGPIAHGNGEPKSPQVGQTLNNNRVALSTTYTRAGVNRTVGAIDLEANGFFSEIPPEVVDEAGNPVTVTEAAAALPQMNGSGMVRNLRAAVSLSGHRPMSWRRHSPPSRRPPRAMRSEPQFCCRRIKCS